MKFSALALVVLALGVAVGLALNESLDRPASADPVCPGPSAKCQTPTPTPPPQQREDQVVLSATRTEFVAGGWQKPSATYYPIVALDASDYPTGSVFSFEAVLAIESANTTGCTRLYNLTTSSAVEDSEVCLSVTDPDVITRLRSGPVSLTNGENEYTIESMCQPACGVSWRGTRIIVEWTE